MQVRRQWCNIFKILKEKDSLRKSMPWNKCLLKISMKLRLFQTKAERIHFQKTHSIRNVKESFQSKDNVSKQGKHPGQSWGGGGRAAYARGWWAPGGQDSEFAGLRPSLRCGIRSSETWSDLLKATQLSGCYWIGNLECRVPNQCQAKFWETTEEEKVNRPLELPSVWEKNTAEGKAEST